MTAIATSIDDVTAAWLREATGLDVTDVEVEQIGIGVGVSSALYRCRLRGGDCPTSVVVKLPALDPAAVFTSTVLRMYIREVRFFEELAGEAPIRVPAFHHGQVDEETSSFVVVMEDLSGMRIIDQNEGMSPEDAERAVDAVARWHARWWRRADDLAASGLTVSLADPIYPAVLPLVFAEGWEKLNTELGSLPPAIQSVGPRFSDAIEPLLQDLAADPTTMIHGDFRADNILFEADGTPVLLDFQLIGTGSGAYDLAYFVTQSLEPEVASTHERALFDRWCAGLLAGGVPEADLAGLWLSYRKAALFCLVYPVVASRGMDLSDPRQRRLIECMNARFARAVEELDLEELL